MNGFLTLDEVVFRPPLPAISSLVLTAGVAGWADWGLRRWGIKPDPIRLCAAFITAAGVFGAMVHGLAMAQMASIAVLRVIAVLAAVQAWRVWGMVRGLRWNWFWIPVGLLGLGALGPVTDADSLDYHLGVPLDWLRHGGIVFEPHWLHARITGLGEALNMLGLAAGTDGFGSVLQVCGLGAIAVALRSVAKTARQRNFAMMLALAPAVLPLALSQKPQLLPVAATVLAMILARRAENGVDYALLFGCLGFAMASKYSFYASSVVVGALAVYWAREKGKAMGWAAMALVVFVVPVLVRNVWLYGDPVSPFLETLRKAPDAEVLHFAAYLRNAGEPHTIGGMGRYLAGLMVPGRLGDVQTVLGIGVLCVLLMPATEWRWAAIGVATAVTVFTLWRGQMAPRYLLEPYYWCAIAAVAGPWSRWKSVLFYGLAAQTAGVAAMAAVGAALLFPGALTAGLRERVMMRSTYGFAEARWIDRVLPGNATIMAEGRAYALMPRPFFIGNVPRGEAGFVVLHDPFDSTGELGCELRRVAGPMRFEHATRNWWNRSSYWVILARPVCR